MVKGLVCGMQVDEMYPPARIIYQGKEYLFCCKECQEAFEKEPEKYLEQQDKNEGK